MKGEEKYLARHHLDVYSEIKFSGFLKNCGFHVFFPFEDKGIDIAAFRTDNLQQPIQTGEFDQLFLFQLKARNLGRYGNY